jgi:hypothetical protein
MKTANKKMIGGLLIGILFIATIGAVYATGQTDGTSNDTSPQIPFGGRHKMNGLEPFASDLTEEQQAEINKTITSLRDQNATPAEIQAAIQEKLDEFGVMDIQLDNEIAQTEQRLQILNREKELRNEGYSWDEIRNIIQDEFDLQNTTGAGFDMMMEHGFEHGPCGEPRGFIKDEESDQ